MHTIEPLIYDLEQQLKASEAYVKACVELGGSVDDVHMAMQFITKIKRLLDVEKGKLNRTNR